MDERYPAPTSELEPYDEELYDEFLKYANFEAFQYLTGEKSYRETQKTSFLSGEIRNPTLDYPDLDLERIAVIETNLVKQKQYLLENEQNEVVKQAYRWRLNYAIAEARLLKAAAQGDMNRFQHYTEFVYGKPSPEIFAFSASSLRKKAAEAASSENQDLAAVGNQLLSILPDMVAPDSIGIPLPQTVEIAAQQTNNELGDLIDLPSQDGELNAVDIKQAFEGALEKLGADGWDVEIDDKSSRTAISISQEKEKVQIPESRSVKSDTLKGLIVHELGTHVARRVNGERSRLKLLGLGLDRYTRGEEGIATMREQVIEGEVDDFSGLDGHLAISLAVGLDGKPRDFREVFDILTQVKLMANLQNGKEPDQALQKAQDSAWNRCVRTFRGTDCKTAGVCFTQDIIYREGNIGVWDVIKDNPEEMMRFNVGKYDPSNERHLWILEQLGISDDDLISLES